MAKREGFALDGPGSLASALRAQVTDYLCQEFASRLASTRTLTTLMFAASVGPLLLDLSSAVADTCTWSDKVVGRSEDNRYVVMAELNHATRRWHAVWHDTIANSKSSTILTGIEGHAHLTILVPPKGQAFAVLDPSAGHREKHRIQIYDCDGALIKSYGLNDVLNNDELSKVERSISHIQWIGYDKPNKRWHWLNETGTALEFFTMAGRKVQIMLNDKSLSSTPSK